MSQAAWLIGIVPVRQAILHAVKTKKPCQTGFRQEIGAGNEIRTRDPNLGKVVLYQLSYSRMLKAERVF
jgi:hypothetical protein